MNLRHDDLIVVVDDSVTEPASKWVVAKVLDINVLNRTVSVMPISRGYHHHSSPIKTTFEMIIGTPHDIVALTLSRYAQEFSPEYSRDAVERVCKALNAYAALWSGS